jgi:hypothetical protein
MDFNLELLNNYGVLGLWTISLILERVKFLKEFKELIKENTEAMRKMTYHFEAIHGNQKV